MDDLHAFVVRFSDRKLPEVSDEELNHICSTLLVHATVNIEDTFEVLQCLSYFTLDAGPRGAMCLEIFEKVINILYDQDQLTHDEILDRLINKLRPLLLRISENERQPTGNALKPHIGMSYKEDEQRREWKEQGGLKSIPFFYVVLRHLQNRDVSSNVWWITPGILNLLDDTNDINGVKLKGVFLLGVFLEYCFGDQKNWVSFYDLGLFELYRPVLLNMCYYLPPAYDSGTSLQIMKTVFPVLNSLYRLQFFDSDLDYKYHLGQFLSEILLQNLVPRINLSSEPLTEYALQIISEMIKLLGTSSAVHLQRIVYVIGEYLVRNPFFTAFESLMHGTLNIIETLIVTCADDRIVAHKYDFLGLLLITLGKCKQEGKLTPAMLCKLRGLRRSLEKAGCNFTTDKEEFTAHRDMHEFFN